MPKPRLEHNSGDDAQAVARKAKRNMYVGGIEDSDVEADAQLVKPIKRTAHSKGTSATVPPLEGMRA
eukprot:10575034-Lingulodinium_polyedra.AAC.1